MRSCATRDLCGHPHAHGQDELRGAKEFFVREGYQSAKIADIESKRGTSDPTYLYYTWGNYKF